MSALPVTADKLTRLDGHSLNTNEVKLFNYSVLNL
jgi:hypothetical protein